MQVKRHGWWVVTSLLLAAVLAVPSTAGADHPELHVTTFADVVDGTDGELSLREAVIEANAAPGEQTIHLPEGEYQLTRCQEDTDEDAALWGDLDLTDPDGVVVTGKFPEVGEPIGEGARVAADDSAPVVVQTCAADDHQRLLHNLEGAGRLTVERVVLEGGHGAGGAAVLSYGPLTMTDGVVRESAMWDVIVDDDEFDAAVAVIDADVEMVRTQVSDNDAVGVAVRSPGTASLDEVAIERNGIHDTGGVVLYGGGTIEDSVIRDNKGSIGGGVASYVGSTVIERSLIEGNQAMIGGGVHGPVEIRDSVLRDNIAIFGGGGLVIGSVERSVVEANYGGGVVIDGIVDASTLTGNTVLGGVLLMDGATLSRSTVTGNEGTNAGGVTLYAEEHGEPPTAQILSSTVAGNHGVGDEGPADELSPRSLPFDRPAGTLHLQGTAIGEGADGPSCLEIDGTIVSDGFNADDDDTCGLQPSKGDLIDQGDLELGPLTDNGGATPTRLPVPTSPLVDRIPTGDVACTGVDQRGVVRPQAGGCDIGAAEVDLADVAGGFVPTSPTRVLDTRFGPTLGIVPVGEPVRAPVLHTLHLIDVVPDEATAVVLNITSTQATTSDSYVTLWPGGFPEPLASTLNLQAGANVANSATVRLGAASTLHLRMNVGSSHLIIDVLGYYLPGAGDGFEPTGPVRALDTRFGPVPPGRTVGQPLAGPGTVRLPLAGQLGVPADATAVAVNVTATESTSGLAFVTAWPSGEPQPVASNLNLQPGFSVANLAVVELGTGGAIDLFTNVGATHLIVDVVGYYSPSSEGRLVALRPQRLMDTRGGPAVAPGTERDLQIAGVDPVPDDIVAAVLNATSTQASSSFGYLTLYPQGLVPRPVASTLNYRAGVNVPNQVMTGVSNGGAVSLYNGFGTVHYVVDVNGYFVDIS